MSANPPAISDLPVLKLLNVESAYGPIKAIRGVSLQVRRDSEIKALSRGMRQRLCFAKTLLHQPKVLLLDEPASGMDPAQVTVLTQLVKGTTGEVLDWDNSDKAPVSLTASGEPVSNRIRVTVGYRWSPGLFFGGALTLKSICEIPMSF